MSVLDLFAGPGGWSVALRERGLEEYGVEWDGAACDTAVAAGHHRNQMDVRDVRVDEGQFDGLIASPPCQTFSTAGKGDGRGALDILLEAAPLVAAGMTPVEVAGQVRGGRELDERSWLVLEPLRVIRDLRPEWVALEQVPSVLPIWAEYAKHLFRWGYSVDWGHLHAEQYGVPQTRRRAFLVANRTGLALLPSPTHSRYYSRSPKKLDPGLKKWVSMAEALGWGTGELVGFPRLADRPGDAVTIGDTAYRGRDLREAGDPSQTVTEKARSWERFPYLQSAGRGSGPRVRQRPRPVDEPAATITGKGTAYWTDGAYGPAPGVAPEDVVYVNGTHEKAARRPADRPAPTVMFGHRLNSVHWVVDREAVAAEVAPRVNNQSGTEFDLAWPADRPAPVVAGREIVTMPGANANRYNGRTKSRNDGIRVTVEEAGVLQSFPRHYPWQGTKTAQFRQVGDAVPPLLAGAVIDAARAL